MKSISLALALLFVCWLPASAQENNDNPKIKHVLLISVDGLHALDAARYIHTHPGSALAQLAGHGVNYTNAKTPSLSDSFPGLLALVTGGSPISHGLFYDVSYDRTIFDPSNTTCAGSPGNTMVFDESIDAYNAANVSQNVIDPATLPRYRDNHGDCLPLFPHNAIRSNTVFEVVKASGGRTAWADKHPAYELVNGPSGHGVDDLFTPEITNVNGFDATFSVVCTFQNDVTKVNAILNEIYGLTHSGAPGAGVPALFGMNFQAVSVGQKLAKDNRDGSCFSDTLFTGQKGGYLDADGTPSPILLYALDHVDAALGRMIAALKAEGLYDSTLFIVSAKHGQSPIDPKKVKKPGHFADLVAALPDASSAAAQAIVNAGNCSTGPCGMVQDDDVALIWLADQKQTDDVAAYLNQHAADLFIDEVIAGDDLRLKFNSPLTDGRTPDILVQPIYGTIYTASSKKIAEHGGLSFGDTNVALIVSNPAFKQRTVKTPVATSQVAPTLLRFLGLDPSDLKAVRKEGTPILPQFPFPQQ